MEFIQSSPVGNVMQNTKVSKSPLDKKTLEHFRNILLAKRKSAEEQIRIASDNIYNRDSENDPDYLTVSDLEELGSGTERDSFNYQMMDRTRKYIQQIDDALERIDNGTYGICQATGRPISRARLEAVPHTRFSIYAKKKGLAEDE